MSESKVIHASGELPVTRDQLVRDLRALGVREGDALLVHTSLSRLGWVCGGAQAVIEALIEAIGRSGTLVMPAFSTSITDPAHWVNPPVPESWWPIIRAHSPAFDPQRTPTRMIGAVAELFRTWPGAERSAHPHDSFAALGPASAAILHPHPLEDGMGESSPLARLYDLDARILLLGVGHANNSSLHFAEHRAEFPGKRRVTEGAPMASGWVEFETLYHDEDDFEAIGAAFGARATRGPVGCGEALLMSQRELVDFGAAWMTRNRGR
ncbi:MAG: AAC(3) family N-acetyltransferase [Planctomycetota bacterium]